MVGFIRLRSTGWPGPNAFAASVTSTAMLASAPGAIVNRWAAYNVCHSGRADRLRNGVRATDFRVAWPSTETASRLPTPTIASQGRAPQRTVHLATNGHPTSSTAEQS